MKKTIYIHNPPRRKKTRKRKTVRAKKRIFTNKKNTFKKGVSKMARRKRTSVKRRRVRKNPAGVTYIKNRKRVSSRVRGRRRFRKNPADLPGKTTDLLTMAAGAGVGGVAVPWIGGIFQLEGMVKYAAQLAISLGGFYLLKRVLPNAALPFAAAGVGVTAYQFAQENNILAGLNGFNDADMQNFEQMRAAIPMGNIEPGMISGNILPGQAFPQIVEGENEGLEEYADSLY